MDDEMKAIAAGLIRHGLTTLGGVLVADGYLQSADTSAFVGGGMVFAGIIWSWYQKRGHAAMAAELGRLKSAAKIVLLGLAVTLIFSAAPGRASDLAKTPTALQAINTALNGPSHCVAAGNCSGWYAVFGMGAQSNAGTPNLLAGGLNSAFSDGLDIYAGGGYQLWNGQWLAGIEVTAGYEFTNGGVKPKGGNFLGTEFVKLGYNFLPSSAAAAPAAGQNPFLNLVPANFLAASTPSVIVGGVQRHGLSVAAVGAEIDTVISAGWSSYAQLYNSPSQQGLPSDTTLRIGLQRHF